jgi:hypothetical protein
VIGIRQMLGKKGLPYGAEPEPPHQLIVSDQNEILFKLDNV